MKVAWVRVPMDLTVLAKSEKLTATAGDCLNTTLLEQRQ